MVQLQAYKRIRSQNCQLLTNDSAPANIPACGTSKEIIIIITLSQRKNIFLKQSNALYRKKS